MALKVNNYTRYVLIVTAGLLCGVCLKITLTPIWRRPAASIQPTLVDFGEVPAAQVYTAVFKVRNRGRSPLDVTLLRANCACSIAEMCPSPILPTQQSSIKVRIKAPEAEAHFGSGFVIKTNDPRNPRITLKMHGKAVSVLNIAPVNLLLGDVHVTDLPLAQTVLIRPGRLSKPRMLESLNAKCEHPALDLSLTKTSNQATLHVTLRSDVPIGVVRSNISITIADYNDYTLNIPVVSHVRGDYDIHPASLFFGKVRSGTSVTKQSVITPFRIGDTIDLLSDQSEIPDGPLKVDIQPRTGSALIRGTFSAPITKGVFEKTLTFRLTPKDATSPQYLQIPAVAIITRPTSNQSPTIKTLDHSPTH